MCVHVCACACACACVLQVGAFDMARVCGAIIQRGPGHGCSFAQTVKSTASPPRIRNKLPPSSPRPTMPNNAERGGTQAAEAEEEGE